MLPKQALLLCVLIAGSSVCVACSDLVVVGKIRTREVVHSVKDAGEHDPEARPPAAGDDSSPPGAVNTDSGSGGTSRDAAMPARRDTPTFSTEPDVVSIDTRAHEQFCTGHGPPLIGARPAGTPTDCNSRIARRLFSHALCACNELRIQGDAFRADSFDSRTGDDSLGQTGAAIGANVALSVLTQDAQLLGSLSVVGNTPAQITGRRFKVSGDFKTNASLPASLAGSRFARDLWLDGDVLTPMPSTTVGRDVHQTPGHALGDLAVAGRVVTSNAFRLPPPCACDQAALLDIPALVAQARTANDNNIVGSSSDAWINGTLTSSGWSLPCGRLFVKGISAEEVGTLTIVALGRTALFVEGDLSVASLATLILFRLPDVPIIGTSELDLFIGGNLIVNADASLWLGDSTRPAALRVYVAGDVRVDGILMLAGQLYAPRATVDFQTPNLLADAYGSVFARNIASLGADQLHYDRAIADADEECSAPAPQRCDGCYQCPGDQACIDGSCHACRADSDCCAPNVCSDGKCQPLVSDAP